MKCSGISCWPGFCCVHKYLTDLYHTYETVIIISDKERIESFVGHKIKLTVNIK